MSTVTVLQHYCNSTVIVLLQYCSFAVVSSWLVKKRTLVQGSSYKWYVHCISSKPKETVKWILLGEVVHFKILRVFGIIRVQTLKDWVFFQSINPFLCLPSWTVYNKNWIQVMKKFRMKEILEFIGVVFIDSKAFLTLLECYSIDVIYYCQDVKMACWCRSESRG